MFIENIDNSNYINYDILHFNLEGIYDLLRTLKIFENAQAGFHKLEP